MKITKLSLVAALLIGSSAFAIDNIKVSGDAKLYYATDDNAGEKITNGNGEVVDSSLFNTANSAGQAAVSLSLSADLTEGVSVGTKVTALSTLGLEGQLVGGVWENVSGVEDTFIVNDLWLATTVAKTTAKVGRMELDTPLVFSEKWSITTNTYEAAVLINQDIPNTTLVGAYVGGANNVGGTAALTTASKVGGQYTYGYPAADSYGGVVRSETSSTSANTTFGQFFNGAYAIGAINNSVENLTLQAWYYDLTHVAQAYWLQADLDMEGILLGAQFTGIDPNAVAVTLGTTSPSSTAYAVMAGYAMKDVATFKIAYSQTSDDLSILKVGQNVGGSQTKLYTEAWWNYGNVTRANTSTINVTIEGSYAGYDLGAYGTISEQSASANVTLPTATRVSKLNEVTLTVSKSVGPVDVMAAYIMDNSIVDPNNAGEGLTRNTLQAYLTYNF